MQRHKVMVLTKNLLLGRYLEQLLSTCPEIEVVQAGEKPDATVVESCLLSQTERKVLETVALCGDIKTAAEKLCRSERTLKRELAAIREKLCVRNTMQAVVWALWSGLISIDGNQLIGNAFRKGSRK